MNAPSEASLPSPLEERLIALIKARGPISIADYMEDALMHPHDGYYTSGMPIGAQGDFTTAPEISQIFGELIGLWLVQSWIDLGEPKSFNLVELGPGRGVLMADILRVAAIKPEFLDAAHVWLVEASGRLRHEQQRRLKDAATPIDWADRFSDIPDGPLLIIANEFFDCLPIRQFVRKGLSWRERKVGVSEGGAELWFQLDETPAHPSIPTPRADEIEDGAIFEYGEACAKAIEEIGAALLERSGRALIIDYGHISSGLGETLQAVKDHNYWPVLKAPGSADITAHVDFERLAQAAFATGLAAHGPVSQGVFLDRLGLSVRVARLADGKDSREREKIESGAFRIAASSEMGEIFKALSLSSPGLSTPAGFTA